MTSQTINSYIQQQIVAAQAEEARLEQEHLTKLAEENAKRKAKSLENTIKALGFFGLEVTEVDLNYDENVGYYYLLYNNVQIALRKSNGVPRITEITNTPFVAAVKFDLILSVVIPEKYRNEDGELARGFYINDLFEEFHIEIRGNGDKPLRASDEDMRKVFTAIPELEANFVAAVARNEAVSSKASTETTNSPVDESFKEWTSSEIDSMHCRQICQDAIRIITYLDATGEASYSSEWLAKANKWLEAAAGES